MALLDYHSILLHHPAPLSSIHIPFTFIRTTYMRLDQRYMFHELRTPINALFLAIDLLHSHLQIEGDAPYSALDGGVLPSSRHPRGRTRTGHSAHHSCIQSNKVVREMMDLVTLHCKALKTLLDDSRYIRRLMSGQVRTQIPMNKHTYTHNPIYLYNIY